PTYMTGAAAVEQLRDRPEVSQVLIQFHQDTALLAFIFMELTGMVAWFGLWQYRRQSRLSGWTSPAVLVLSVLSFFLMARAANFGGEIRHPEIAAVQEAAAAVGEEGAPPSFSASVAQFVTGVPWVWPASETLHF